MREREKAQATCKIRDGGMVEKKTENRKREGGGKEKHDGGRNLEI